MDKRKKLLELIPYFLASLAAILLLAGTAGYQRDGPSVSSVCYVDNMTVSINGGPSEKVSLPHKFRNLPPRTPVTLTGVITPRMDDAVYVKMVYSPAKIYLNGELAFEFGKEQNYPSFMKDPATEIHIIEAHGTGEEMELRMEVLSPTSRSSMTIHPPMVGSSKELIMERSRVLGIPLVFSIGQILGGILLILISICITFIDKKGLLFLWLGLFSVNSGAWAFGENNFSGIIFRHSAFLYILSFVGMFTFIVPLIHFTRRIIDFEDARLVVFMEYFCTLAAAGALFLQLFGVMSCSASMYFFHVCLPPVLIILALMTVREYARGGNINARRYILPISVLAVTAVLELFNYQAPFTYVFSSIFQMGILFFLLYMGVMAGLTVKDSLDLQNRQKELTFEKNLIELQIKDQQERGALIAVKEELLSQQRHDLRHQLTAIQALASPDNTQLQNYLSSLMDSIPKKEKTFCENRAVNAVISHYASICEKNHIEFSCRLVVPLGTNAQTDSELSAIFGNLLENAVEACGRMSHGEKFIRINSALHYKFLAVTMENSFSGQLRKVDGRFLSSKRDDFGIGLMSVQSVCRKCNGDVEFRSEGNVFHSEVYLRI